MKTLMLGLGKMTQLEKHLLSKHDPGLDPSVHVKSQACDPTAGEAETQGSQACPPQLPLAEGTKLHHTPSSSKSVNITFRERAAPSQKDVGRGRPWMSASGLHVHTHVHTPHIQHTQKPMPSHSQQEYKLILCKFFTAPC